MSDHQWLCSGGSKRALASMTGLRRARDMKSPTMGRALREPWPQRSLRRVMRGSLKPAQAPVTISGCMRMNQPSALPWVVPVLPATSAWMP